MSHYRGRIVSSFDPNVTVPRPYAPLTKTQAARIISRDLRILRKAKRVIEGKDIKIDLILIQEYLAALREQDPHRPPMGEFAFEAAEIANPRTILREIQRADQPTKERVKS